jgi:hypothetical protein
MFNLIAFFTAFFLGFASGTLLPKVEATSVAAGPILTTVAEANAQDGRLEIVFAGWERAESNTYPRLRFVLNNGTSDRLYFRGYSADNPWPVIQMGEKKLMYYWCGTGVGRHFIEPGKSLTFEVSGHPFRDHRDPKSRFTVGLDLSTSKKYDEKSELIQTQPFALPEDFIEDLASLKD